VHRRFPRSLALLSAFALSGCAGNLSALSPAGPSASAIATLWWIMLFAGFAIFAATTMALAVAWWRPAWLGQRRSRTLILWGGLVLPSAILVALVGSAFALGERLLVRRDAPARIQIEAVARQWQWEFRYPGGSTSLDILHLPAGEDVDLVVTTEDVIHSLWVPRLGGKIDAIPGHRNRIRLHADVPGRFGGICAEFCGERHAEMHFSVEAHEEPAFMNQLQQLGRNDP